MRTLTIVAALALLAAPLGAQEGFRNERHGFWLGAGIGPGSVGLACATCRSDRVNGAAGYFRLGGTLSQHFLVGAEVGWWSITFRSSYQTSVSPVGALYWYPSRKGAWYFKAGLGALSYSVDNTTLIDTNGAYARLSDAAGAVTLGVGYEARVARNISVVPYLNVYKSGPVSKREIDGVRVSTAGDDIKRDIVQFGVGLTFH